MRDLIARFTDPLKKRKLVIESSIYRRCPNNYTQHTFNIRKHSALIYTHAWNSQYSSVCGRESESVILCEPALHKYTPASSGKTGSTVQVVTGPSTSMVRRSEEIRVLTGSPSMSKKRTAVLEDAVQLTMTFSPGLTLFADRSKAIGSGWAVGKVEVRTFSNAHTTNTYMQYKTVNAYQNSVYAYQTSAQEPRLTRISTHAASQILLQKGLCKRRTTQLICAQSSEALIPLQMKEVILRLINSQLYTRARNVRVTDGHDVSFISLK